MRGAGTLVVTLLAVGLAVCGGAEADGLRARSAAPGGVRASGAPEVEAAFQERVDEAWRRAVAGENPATTCAGVKGRAAVTRDGAAVLALAACNVEVPVRYFLTYAGEVEVGRKTCREFMMEVMTKLPAMTFSTEGFAEIARLGSEADTSAPAAVGAATAILAGEAAAGGGAGDPDRIVKDRLRERVTAVCPNEAALILH